MFILHALGRFRLLGVSGTDHTPVGQKARGVIALLALAPDFTRSRSWLQDKLWSDRDPIQSAASLRQALTEIRHALGLDMAVLRSNRNSVSLNPSEFQVSFIPSPSLSPTNGDVELFEDLNIKDPEFEHWIRDQRLSREQSSAQIHLPKLNHTREVVIFSTNLSPDHDGFILVTQFFARAAKSLMNETDTLILDHTSSARNCLYHRPDRGIWINLSISFAGDLITVSSMVDDVATDNVYWASELILKGTIHTSLESYRLLGLASQTVGAVTSAIVVRGEAGTDSVAALRLFSSAQTLTFTLDKANLARADRQCLSAFEMDPRGRYHAWRALIRTISHFQYQGDDFLPDRQGVENICSSALEQFPDDSMALSVGSHAEYLFGNGTSSALRLAELAIQIDPLNPIAWAAISNVQIATADYAAGFHSAKTAIDLSAGTRSMYFFEFYACMAAAGLGNYHDAINHARTSSLLCPKFAAPQRYLVALRTATGDRAGLDKALFDLRTIEPTFEIKSLLDCKYPVNTLRRLPLISGIERSVRRGEQL